HKVASLRRHIRLTVVVKRKESAVRHAVGNRAETARGWESSSGRQRIGTNGGSGCKRARPFSLPRQSRRWLRQRLRFDRQILPRMDIRLIGYSITSFLRHAGAKSKATFPAGYSASRSH